MLKLMAKDGVLRRIIEAATAAPSIHNTQPWRFVAADDLLEVRSDPDRTLWVADPRARALYLSCGAALFNIRTAIRMTGYNPLVWPLPQPRFSPLTVAVVQAEPGRPPAYAERELYEAIWQRHTNRAPFTAERVPDPVLIALEQAASAEFATLRLLGQRDTATVLDLAERADAELAGDVEHQIELQQWIATDSRSDGIPADALPGSGKGRHGPVRSGDLAAAAPSVTRPVSDYEAAPQIAVLATIRDTPADWLRAGQALQRVLLTATARGVSTSFLYQPIELRDMHGESAPAWPWPENPQMLVRIGFGPQSAGTPRRPVEDVLTRAAGE